MLMHPAEIAKEMATFHFFRSFSEDILLQIATMVETSTFSEGEIILTEGQKNSNLYFIRKGSVEVLFAGITVSVLQKVGEVFGEMSVLTNNPVATTIRSSAETDCFIINSDKFNFVHPKDKDRLWALFYRVYSTVLAERLVKTNEKARFFEIANQELHQAQVALEDLGAHSVLLGNTDAKQLFLAKMAVGGTGVKLDTFKDLDSAIQKIQSCRYDAIIGNESFVDLFKVAHKNKVTENLVLVSSRNNQNDLKTLENLLFINNVITIDEENRNETIKSLLRTLTKVLTKDIFGIEKYMNWGVDIQSHPVIASKDRQNLNSQMINYFKNLGIRSTYLDRASAVVEEMLMNCIYDAPVDAKGNPLFNSLSRRNEVVLDFTQRSELRYACDGILMAVSVSDPFGALTKGTILKYLRSCYEGQAGVFNEADPAKGGAGRGLHQIIENSDLTIFNVKQGIRTEIISLFYLERGARDTRPGFNYFFI